MSKRPPDGSSASEADGCAGPSSEKHPRLENNSGGTTKEAQRAALRNGIYLSKVEGLPDNYNVNALSLRELISAINPVASVHFNYCCDPEFVIR